MPRGETVPPLPSRAHALRSRIFHLEEKHAREGYPDRRAALAEEIAAAIAEFQALVPKIEAEAEQRKEELKRAQAELPRKRQELLRLLGQLPEPPPTNAVGAPLGISPPFERVYEYPVASLCHYGEPTFRNPRLQTKQEAAEWRAKDDPNYWLRGGDS